jgi:hypothetical protein
LEYYGQYECSGAWEVNCPGTPIRLYQWRFMQFPLNTFEFSSNFIHKAKNEDAGKLFKSFFKFAEK